MSGLLPMEQLHNTRDIGGLPAADGRRIREGVLFRSGHLFFASENDRRYLRDTVRTIVDFRSEKECGEKPDPVLEGVDYVYLPILSERAPGVEQDEEAVELTFETAVRDPVSSKTYMVQVYESCVTNPFTVSQYRRFLDILLEEPEAAPHKAVLWHCTAGKDRAGFAAVLVEWLLGVKREDIIEDYLATNVYRREETQQFLARMKKEFGEPDGQMKEAFFWLFSAHEEYLEAVFAKAAELYGSFDAYLSEGLKVTEEERRILRARYLE